MLLSAGQKSMGLSEAGKEGQKMAGCMNWRRILPVAALLTMTLNFHIHGAVWKSGTDGSQNKWWYDYEDGTCARNGWYWLDGDQDGSWECYCFDEEGWLIMDTVTPDGYTVNKDGAWTVHGIVQVWDSRQQENEAEERMEIQVQSEGKILRFELNDSLAAKELYQQLPVEIDVSDYSTNEKIFYPSEKLTTDGAPLAQGGAGTLAYYKPWGNVVMFYGGFRSNNSLFELGQVVNGGEFISGLKGRIRIEPVQ